MKVLFVTENYYAGGMDTVIVNLLNYWPATDKFFLVCNYDHPGSAVIEKRLRVPCTVIRHRALTRERLDLYFQGSFLVRLLLKVVFSVGQYLIFAYHFFYFRRLFEVIQPDKVVIVAGNYPGGGTPRAAALMGLSKTKSQKPIFVYHNDPSPVRWCYWLPECGIDFLVKKSVSYLVTVSQFTQNKLHCRFALRNFFDQKVIYNGVTSEARYSSSPNSLRAELGIPDQVPILVMLGTYEPRKGHDFLLQAFGEVQKRFPDAHLITAGYGYAGDRARVDGLAKKYGLSHSAHLLGFREDVTAMLEAAALLVVPSQYAESFGLTIIEAFSHGVPVIATRVGGIPEVLRDGDGGYTVPLDVHLFAEKIIALLQDDLQRKRLGEVGREIARTRFDARRMAAEYHALLISDSNSSQHDSRNT